MKVMFEVIDGEIFVSVYQSIWDDEGGEDFLVHREKVSHRAIEIVGHYYNYHKNKIASEKFSK
uniref:Uncharacterized protein n=1 Tax=Bacillus phage KoopaTroopa TaxID=3234046 RepID=A0AB39C7A7_9CAUD